MQKETGVSSEIESSVRYNVSLQMYSPASLLTTGESIIPSISQSSGMIEENKSPFPEITELVSNLPELSGIVKSRISFARTSILGLDDFSASPKWIIAAYVFGFQEVSVNLEPSLSTVRICDSIL